jgi:hypothetical protein
VRAFFRRYSNACKAWSADPTADKLTALTKTQTAGTIVEAVAQDVILWASYRAVFHAYKSGRVAAFAGLVLAAIGVTLLALNISDVPSEPTPAAVSLQGVKAGGSTQFNARACRGLTCATQTSPELIATGRTCPR